MWLSMVQTRRIVPGRASGMFKHVSGFIGSQGFGVDRIVAPSRE